MNALKRLIIPSDAGRYVAYEPDKGEFVRIASRHRRFIGPISPLLRRDGYHYISVGGVSYLAHRLAWFLHCGEQPDYLDHINGVITDNRLGNLRVATASQNAFNRFSLRALPKGVVWNRSCGKFQAQIRAYGNATYLGVYDTCAEAEAAYRAAANDLHGQFARFSK